MRASRSPSERAVVILLLALGVGTFEARAAEPLKRAKRSQVELTLPQVDLQRDDGQQVSLAGELGEGPVVLTFIFTKCGTICPVMSQTFAQLQGKLGEQVRLVSISIDPEYDTPARLAEYGKKVGAGARWHFYSGTTEATRATQRAFEVLRGDKMDHTPVTFLRGGAGRPWERVDGFASSDELAVELRELAR
jgi:protein SCO1/2